MEPIHFYQRINSLSRLILSKTLLVLCFLFFFLFHKSLNAQALLFIGKADAKLSGAFAYDFLKSPLRPLKEGGRAQLLFNLPFNISAPVQSYLGDVGDSTLVIPDALASISQRFNMHLDVSAPLFGGLAFFAVRENARLNALGALGNGRFNLDTSLAGTGTVLLRGSIQLPMLFDLYWRSLSFGYCFEPNKNVRIGLQVHKHVFGVRLAGDLKPDIAGRIGIQNEFTSASFPIAYPEEKVYGHAQGEYTGQAWSPEVGLQFWRFSLVSRMGVHAVGRGHLDLDYSVPFFIDPNTFESRFSEPDSFLAGPNLKRILNSEVNQKSLHVHSHLILDIPQSHTMGFDLVRDKLTLSYTKVIGQLSIYTESDSGNSKDTTILDPRDYLNATLFPDNILTLSAHFGFFRGTIGANTFNLNYRDQSHILRGILPLEFNGDPLVPILNFGMEWGEWLNFSLDFFILPLPSVRSGITYAF